MPKWQQEQGTQHHSGLMSQSSFDKLIRCRPISIICAANAGGCDSNSFAENHLSCVDARFFRTEIARPVIHMLPNCGAGGCESKMLCRRGRHNERTRNDPCELH